MTQQEESIGGLARRWLKTQLRFHGDPIKSRRDQEEADAIEQRMHEKAHEDASSAVVNALMPDSWKRKIESLERANEEGRIAREQQRRAEHEARARVPVSLTLTGNVVGTLNAEVPIRVDLPHEPGDPLTIDLEPLAPLPVGGHTFLGLLFAVPEYFGPGTYDLVTIEDRLRLETWDPLWFQLTLDTTDDGLYWSPDYGPGTIVVTGSEIELRLSMSNGNGTSVGVDARIQLPSDGTS